MIMETTAIVGIGGAGGNSIQNLYAYLSPDLHYRLIVASSKPDSLELSLAPDELLLTHPEYQNNGKPVNDPRIGQLLAENSLSKMMELLDDVQNVAFIAGLGGGTGSGALPVF